MVIEILALFTAPRRKLANGFPTDEVKPGNPVWLD